MPTNETTNIEDVDVNLETLLAGANNVMIATDTKKTPNMFSRGNNVDLSFLDSGKKEDQVEDTTGQTSTTQTTDTQQTNTSQQDDTTQGVDILNDLSQTQTSTTSTQDSDDTKGKGGRPNGLVELTNKLIEKKLLVPFNDDTPIEKYTLKDFEELYEQNDKFKEKQLMEDLSGKFFDSLPEQLQYAAKYVADGGTDLKSLFQVLSQSEEVKQLDISNERGQEQTVRAYLQATNFGTDDDIDEEINGWKDRNELETKAKKFKPKLDAIQENLVAAKLQKQNDEKKMQMHQARLYQENLYKVLEPDELNGIKLDKKIKNTLYAGLIQPNYPSISGKSTNLLGHLLEKYQWVEPRHDLIAEALWLLSDPEGYKNKIKEVEKKQTIQDTVRTLKTEENRRLASTVTNEEDERGQGSKRAGIPRPTGQQFFKR